MNKDKNKAIPTYKIVMLGASTVGKTSMVNQFVNNFFDALNEETNDDFREYMKLVDLNKSDPQNAQYCLLKIVDLFGIDHPGLQEDGDEKKQEALRRLIKNEPPGKQANQKNIYFRDKEVYGYMFVYDVTSPETLELVLEFIEFIADNERKGNPNVISKKILVGNKTEIDLRKKDPEKVMRTLKECMSKTRMQVMECSAYENYNVNQCFEELARAIYTDVDFEAYEKQKAEQEMTINNQEQEEVEEEAKKIYKKKSTNSGGILGCGGGRGDISDEEDEEDDERIHEENPDQAIDTSNLPNVNDFKGGNCSLF